MWPSHECSPAWQLRSGPNSYILSRAPKVPVVREHWWQGWGERREGRHGLELCWQSCILLWPSLESHTASLLACSVASAASLPQPDSRGGNRVPQSVGRKLTGWDMWIFGKYSWPREDSVWIQKDFIYYFIISPSASPSPSPYYSSSSFFSLCDIWRYVLKGMPRPDMETPWC